MKNMLVVLAHPGDETFDLGLTMVKYAGLGWKIHLICPTNPFNYQSGTAAPNTKIIQKKEYDDAVKSLGIVKTVFFDYRQGQLPDLQTGELEDLIFSYMLSFMPSIIVTYNQKGNINNPDHVKVSYATTYAFQKYAKEIYLTQDFISDQTFKTGKYKKRHFLKKHIRALKIQSFVEAVEDFSQPKLYYVSIPKSILLYLQNHHAWPKELYDKPLTGIPDDAITNVINGRNYKKTKLEAISKLNFQPHNLVKYVKDDSSLYMTQEYFVLRMWGTQEVYFGKNDRIQDRL